MEIKVVHRRWRYRSREGLVLIVTQEYKRVIKLITAANLIKFKHKICKLSRNDGSPYDEVEIKIK